MKTRKTPVLTLTAVAAVTMSVGSAEVLAAPSGDSPDNETQAAPETTTTTQAPTTTTTAAPTTTTSAAPSTTTTGPAASTTTTSSPGSSTTTTTRPGNRVDPEDPAGGQNSTLPPGPVSTPVPAPAAMGVGVPVGGDYGAILMTIRTLESGNRYEIGKNKGGASGAYQFIDRTWGNFGGYASAYLAPPAVQDQKALADVKRFLAMWGGDVSMVPVMWYYPKAAYNPALMDQVPMPGAGNTLTIRQYQHKWMKIYQRFSGKQFDLSLYESNGVGDQLGTPPVVVSVEDTLEQVAFPVLGPSRVEADASCTGLDCENGQDVLVYGTELQPVLTAFDGSVTAVNPGDAVTGEVSVTITDQVGRTYTYSGFKAPFDAAGNPNASLSLSANARVGASVRAGTVLGFMGTTDPTAIDQRPHIRLTIQDQFGVRLDAHRLVTEAQVREACRVGIGPWSMPANSDIGADPANPTFEPISVPVSEDGSFTIAADGTVNAIGLGALIVPDEGCAWLPQEPFGPNAAGEPMPDEKREQIDIDLSLLINGSDEHSLR